MSISLFLLIHFQTTLKQSVLFDSISLNISAKCFSKPSKKKSGSFSNLCEHDCTMHELSHSDSDKQVHLGLSSLFKAHVISIVIERISSTCQTFCWFKYGCSFRDCFVEVYLVSRTRWMYWCSFTVKVGEERFSAHLIVVAIISTSIAIISTSCLLLEWKIRTRKWSSTNMKTFQRLPWRSCWIPSPAE